MVPKKHGSWRLCGDYRKLNSQTVSDKYPIPHIHDFTHALDGNNFYYFRFRTSISSNSDGTRRS
ncbi:hypothetical protein WN51_00121 [Melipona quadrifasciata]|uniref:Uncharacterized protein n=1 Tax=Melipona quadrifasciata TaxID=166423 RepID=A0A0M9ADQ2_9HYME|nr:hypothetical protein WN51_00121 [Melipona quadrifasciata]